MKVQIYNQRFNDGLGFKTIARNLGISKNTVKSYVKEFEKNLDYYNTLSAKEYDAAFVNLFKKNKMDVSKRKSKLITNEIERFIKYCLKENKKKIDNGNRKMIMKNIDIYEKLVEDYSYSGSRTTVNNFIARTLDKTNETFIKRYFDAGEICEFDWGNVQLEINGEQINMKLAVFYLPYSKHRVCYLYEHENMEAFVDSHIRFINEMGCVPKTFVYDNMRVAVAIFTGKQEKKPTQTLIQMSVFYGFKFRFCNAYKGNEKGGVERSVEYLRRKVFSYNNQFGSIEDAKSFLKTKQYGLNAVNNEKFQIDINAMKKKEYDFVYGQIENFKVDKYSTISVKAQRYSVPDKYTLKIVKVKTTIDYVHIYYNNQHVATHNRLIGGPKWNLNIMHYTNVLKVKPGGINDSLAFKKMSTTLRILYEDYFEGEELEFIKTLELVKEYSLDDVHQTIDKLLKYSSTISYESINMCLNTTEQVVPLQRANNELIEATQKSINKYARLGD